MKKTYTINLSGKIFHIDDDALDKLQVYINTLKTHYSREEDGKEIMDDIENRIGELFTEYLKEQYREVITSNDVERVIATMGSPADIIDEDEQPQKATPKQGKKLYRSPDSRVLGGVAGGMAAYWGISPLLLRVCFVILTFYYGIFFIVYLILWIAVPKAKTAKQKLEMKGEDINVSNIERSFKEEYQEVKNGKAAKYAGQVGKGITKVLRAIVKAASFLTGIVLFASGVFFLFALLSFLFLPHWYPWGDSYTSICHALSATNWFLSRIGILLLLGIPVIMIIFMAIKLLFSFKSNNKAIALSALAGWLLGLVMVIIVGVSEGATWSPFKRSIIENVHVNTSKPLTIQVNSQYLVPHDKRSDKGVLRLPTSNVFAPCFKVRSSHDSTASIVVQYTTHENIPNRKNVKFKYSYKNDTLCFDNYAQLTGKWRAQSIDVVLYLPENMQVDFTPQAVKHLGDNRHSYYPLYYELNDTTRSFIMQDGELKALR